MMRGQPRESGVAVLCAALMLAGCATTPLASDVTMAPEPSATPAEPSWAPHHVRVMLGAVDWPDDVPSIKALFDSLPDHLAGLTLSARLHGPDPAGSAEWMDGFLVRYGTAGRSSTIELMADPGAGISSPVHGMATTIVYSGGPEHCADADHSPLLDDLFGLEDSADLQQELRRIAEVEPVLGELVWLVCTMTVDGDLGVPRARSEWPYVAYWADGGWLYWVRADSAPLRDVAVATLSALAAPLQAPGTAR